MTDVQRVLAKLRKAKTRDEADLLTGELARAAQQSPVEVVDLYYTRRKQIFSLVWCLHGLKNEAVIDLYQHALNHKDKYVRWAAIEGLAYSHEPALNAVFVAALKDRSPMVKGVAVEWLKSHGDSTALGPLERLVGLPSLATIAPGIVKQAKAAMRLIRARGK